jgi:phosphomannomutase
VPLKIAEILDKTDETIKQIREKIPIYPRIKEEIECSDVLKFEVVNLLIKKIKKEFNNINTLDGLKITFEEGWILIRPSNTSPIIRLTAEANNEKELIRIVKLFRKKTEEIIEDVKKTKS